MDRYNKAANRGIYDGLFTAYYGNVDPESKLLDPGDSIEVSDRIIEARALGASEKAISVIAAIALIDVRQLFDDIENLPQAGEFHD